MINKTVYMYLVDLSYEKTFEEVLLDAEFQKDLAVNQFKTTELKHVSKEKNGTIIGMFVSHSKKRNTSCSQTRRRRIYCNTIEGR